ncbi:MAG TPA: ATP phosphoribosyltransferase regulatory subunit [Leucothrix sp.]|nr:ATP phosphoribosyltransferase regulatory subunit [Leucothrix sp.]
MNTWLLPDGINESLPGDAERLEALRRHLVDLYSTWGYGLVMPPLVEYLESLRAGMGTQLDLQTFKITDQLNGRMMGIRADMTPQVARIDAHHLSKGNTKATVNRLCYIGTVLRTRSEQQGGSRSPVQVGAELFGHAGIESDYEIISLMLETLHSIDVIDLVLDLGHVGIASGLAKHANLDNDQRETYFDMLARKSIPEIEEWVGKQKFSNSDAEMLCALPLLSGSIEIINKARDILKNAEDSVLDALDHLKSICELLVTNYPELKLHIDLTEMRGYAYHTGVMYTVYLPGRGRSIAHGGRYNGIGKAFGNARPAVGFSTDLRTLAELSMETVSLINSLGANGILAPYNMDKELASLIAKLRAQGEQVIRQLDQKSQFTPEQQGCNRILEKQDSSWVVVPIA